jgi:hypothetical protein
VSGWRRARPAGHGTALVVLLAVFALWGPSAATAQAPPPDSPDTLSEATDLVNALLGGLMGGGAISGEMLQEEVAEAGGLPFRRPVKVAFLSKDELTAYLRELLAVEYPEGQARADERLLRAFDLLPAGVGLRELRARVLEDNVAGFYDERPQIRQLYAVSADRSFTPMNQIVLAHELRHAQQDQYEDLHAHLADTIGDFDDRRLAYVSLLEGDATLVMERFLRLRLGGLGREAGGGDGDVDDPGAAGLAVPGLLDLPGAPPVVRDQLVEPYLKGLVLARAIWARGGAEAMRDAWRRPPESTEQVLHPEKFFAGEPPRVVTPALAPPAGARLVAEGVLGELLLRTLLDEAEGGSGWGGDGYRLWDVDGQSLLIWRSEWDSPAAAAAFRQALGARFARHRGAASPRGEWDVFGGADTWRFAIRSQGDAVELVSAERPELLQRLVGGR